LLSWNHCFATCMSHYHRLFFWSPGTFYLQQICCSWWGWILPNVQLPKFDWSIMKTSICELWGSFWFSWLTNDNQEAMFTFLLCSYLVSFLLLYADCNSSALSHLNQLTPSVCHLHFLWFADADVSNCYQLQCFFVIHSLISLDACFHWTLPSWLSHNVVLSKTVYFVTEINCIIYYPYWEWGGKQGSKQHWLVTCTSLNLPD